MCHLILQIPRFFFEMPRVRISITISFFFKVHLLKQVVYAKKTKKKIQHFDEALEVGMGYSIRFL